jgi:hypothetical protein
MLLLFAGSALFAQEQKTAAPLMTAAASTDAVRFTSTPGVVQLRVEVVSPGGTTLYDSGWKGGNVFDWIVADGFGHPLPYGPYRLVIRSKDLEGSASEKETTLHVAADRVAIDGAPGTDLQMTTTAHDGETGQLVTTSGDLSFRFGDFLNRKDAEKMRLTAEGDLGIGIDKPQARLDVNGLIRTSEGIVFPDGSIQRSAAMPSIVRMRPSNRESDKKLNPKSDIGGAGTTNQVTKWLDGPAGTVGDSAITEVGGKVGIGTLAPGAQLHIYGASSLDVFAGMGPDVISGPGFNYGYAGNSFGVGAGFFNVRPATGATGENPSLRFMTVDQQRMIITNAGNVGIGTSAPSQKLDVAGTVTLSGNLALPATASGSVGVITLGGLAFVHNFGASTNAFLGAFAGNFTMTGTNNMASGYGALYSNTSGSNNTASGASALYNNTSGSNNTASGYGALYGNTTGSTNLGVGLYAGFSLTTGDNNIDIGNLGVAAEGNTIRIGTSQTKTFIAGIRGVTTAAAAIPVLVDTNGQLGTVSSSRRSKFDITGMGDATDGLMRLRPVTFRYRAHGDNAPLQYGLIAEEVADVYPELVARNKDGEVETVMYQFLAPMLLNEVQKQQKTIDRLEQRLEALEKQLASK